MFKFVVVYFDNTGLLETSEFKNKNKTQNLCIFLFAFLPVGIYRWFGYKWSVSLGTPMLVSLCQPKIIYINGEILFAVVCQREINSVIPSLIRWHHCYNCYFGHGTIVILTAVLCDVTEWIDSRRDENSCFWTYEESGFICYSDLLNICVLSE